MDRLTKEQRRKNMQNVRSKDSEIELKLRSELWKKGFRYRKNFREVFGCPDIVFKKLKIAVFVDSEFWHGFDWENRKNDFKSNCKSYEIKDCGSACKKMVKTRCI